MTGTPPVLIVDTLQLRIPTRTGWLHAIEGVSFELHRGRTLCIVGESGCGKSLTALSLMGLQPTHSSRAAKALTFEGEDLQTLNAAKLESLRGHRIAMIFQDPMTALNPALTIGTQLMDVMRRHRAVDRAHAHARAVTLLTRVGVPQPHARMRQYPHQQSGGLRQRVMIAMALMCEPTLLIADEPTTALDATVQAQLLELIVELQQETGLSMVFITHDFGVVARIADDVAVMYAGRVVEQGSVEQVLRQSRHPYTQALLNCIPTRGVTRRRSPLPSIAGTVPSLVGGLSGCAFRSRCPQASDACATSAGELMRFSAEGHASRCLLPRGVEHARPDAALEAQ